MPTSLLFNHLSPAVLLGRTSRRHTVVLYLDATPRLTTAMGTHYLGRGERPTVIEWAKVRLYRTVYRRGRTSSSGHSWSNGRWSTTTGSIPPRSRSCRTASICTRGAGRPVRHPLTRRCACCSWEASSNVRAASISSPRQGFRSSPRSSFTSSRSPRSETHRRTSWFTATSIPRSDALLELYASSSIFVLPTMADYSPIAVCEAMAMELPVVTTAVGAVGEMVEDGVNGFVVPAGDANASASATGRAHRVPRDCGNGWAEQDGRSPNAPSTSKKTPIGSPRCSIPLGSERGDVDAPHLHRSRPRATRMAPGADDPRVGPGRRGRSGPGRRGSAGSCHGGTSPATTSA